MASHSAAPSAVRPFLIRGHGGAFGQGGPAMLADQVSVAWADRVARALAPVRDVSRDDSASMIPDSARLLDLIHMPDPSADLVLMAWQKRGRTTKVSIGVSADGLYILDLSADGPHGLIAGTTGAGKSELLQTIIAVLCVANRPDAMTFVLIDYKGGSAFKDCARLPHTVGMVSDLDGHLTVRALDSLGAELKRREEMLPHAGAKDIEDYWDTRRLRPELNLEPMPRLVLVIDEFAAMVAELPDFVHGLIDIARRGRSLGVHLLLATQRPAGVVSADIRANTNLRIALRVTSSDESADVIDAPDSAYIAKSTPGRCYVRSGASNLVAVQSARIGDRRPGTGPVAASAQVMTVPWRGLGRAMPAPAKAAGSDEETMATDLSVSSTRSPPPTARPASARSAGRGWSPCLRSSRSASCPRAAHPRLPVRHPHRGGRRGPQRTVQPAADAGRRGGRAHLRSSPCSAPTSTSSTCGPRSTRWTATSCSSTTPRCCTTRRTRRSSRGSSSPAGTPTTAWSWPAPPQT